MCDYRRSSEKIARTSLRKEEITLDIIRAIDKEQLKTEPQNFEIGDYVRVHLKIVEGSRERVQVFEGTIISRRGEGLRESFTVRRVSYGVGVERVFPVHSPRVINVEIVRKGKVRRAKLYYLRSRVGKSARIREKFVSKDKESVTVSDAVTDAISENNN